MKQTEYVGVVERDGHLSLPKTVRDQMHLEPDQIVRVTIVMSDTEEPPAHVALDCLRSMGQNAARGRLSDASTRHDECLFI